jgi:hypothetical protein
MVIRKEKIGNRIKEQGKRHKIKGKRNEGIGEV